MEDRVDTSQEPDTDIVDQQPESNGSKLKDGFDGNVISESVDEKRQFEPDSVIDAPPAHESIQNDNSEDVLATADVQMQAVEAELKELEFEAGAKKTIPSPSGNDRPTTPIREIPRINVEQATPHPDTIPVPDNSSEPLAPVSAITRKVLSTSSLYFVKKTLDVILSSREGKKKGPLRDVATKTSEMLQDPPQSGVDPNTVFEPLRLACTSQSVTITTQALDCIGKLIAISFFDAPPPATATDIDNDEENPVPKRRADAPTRPLMDRVIDTVCECFQGEGTDEKIQLQIIKALLSAVLDEMEGTMLHQSPLLKAIRQTYNIFLLSRSTPTQSIAQGTLEQMVHAVFSRVKLDPTGETASVSSQDLRSPISPVNGSESEVINTDAEEGKSHSDEQPHEKVTLDSFARRQSFDQIPETNIDSELILSQDEILVKDAFLIFRSMCKLSTKNLAIDNGSDLKSHMVRSKLLSLHMISTILNRHISVFLSPRVIIRSSAKSAGIHFIQATKQYLCHALSRNAVSHIPQVFQVSCEIFWRILDSLRVHLKKEIEVFMIEIYLPILEMKTSSYQQKLTFINVLTRLCNDPRALVEIYLNYDCDRGAMDNIYERYAVRHFETNEAHCVEL